MKTFDASWALIFSSIQLQENKIDEQRSIVPSVKRSGYNGLLLPMMTHTEDQIFNFFSHLVVNVNAFLPLEGSELKFTVYLFSQKLYISFTKNVFLFLDYQSSLH
jgi:hypothetical protein